MENDDIEVTTLDMTVRGLFDMTYAEDETGKFVVLHTRAATIRLDAGEFMAVCRDLVAEDVTA